MILMGLNNLVENVVIFFDHDDVGLFHDLQQSDGAVVVRDVGQDERRGAEESKRDEHLEVAHFVSLDHVHFFVFVREQSVADNAKAGTSEHVHHDQRERMRVITVRHQLLVHRDERGRCGNEH